MAPSIDAPFAPASGTDSKIANKQQVQQDQQVEHGKGALKFAQFDVAEQVFLERDSVLGIVNLMPIVPGRECWRSARFLTKRKERLYSSSHAFQTRPDVLIIPRTPHKRFSNLSPEEVAAVFQTVQETSNVLEKAFGADAMTVSIQVRFCVLRSAFLVSGRPWSNKEEKKAPRADFLCAM